MDNKSEEEYLLSEETIYSSNYTGTQKLLYTILPQHICRINRSINNPEAAITVAFISNNEYLKGNNLLGRHLLIINKKNILNETMAQEFLQLLEQKIGGNKNYNQLEIGQEIISWFDVKVGNAIANVLQHKSDLEDREVIEQLDKGMKLRKDSLEIIKEMVSYTAKAPEILNSIINTNDFNEKFSILMNYLKINAEIPKDEHLFGEQPIAIGLINHFLHSSENEDLKTALKHYKTDNSKLSFLVSNLLIPQSVSSNHELNGESWDDIEEARILQYSETILHCVYQYIIKTDSFTVLSAQTKKEIFYFISKNYIKNDHEQFKVFDMFTKILLYWQKNPELVEYKTLASFFKKIKNLKDVYAGTTYSDNEWEEIKTQISNIIPFIKDLPKDIHIIEKMLESPQVKEYIKKDLLSFFQIVLDKQKLDDVMNSAIKSLIGADDTDFIKSFNKSKI